MARIVNTVVTPILTLVTRTIFDTGATTERYYKLDDMVENLRYVKDNTIYTVSGRIADITHKYYHHTHTYASPTRAKSFFSSDVLPDTITIDGSTEYHSNVVEIPVDDILEYAEEVDVDRLVNYFKFASTIEITLSEVTDGAPQQNNYTIHEGDEVTGVLYTYRDVDYVASGKVVAITVNSPDITGRNLIVVDNGEIREIPITNIKSIDSVERPISAEQSIVTALAESVDENGNRHVNLSEGVFDEPLEIVGNTTISGVNKGISGVNRYNRSSSETVLTGKITMSAGSSLTLDGVTLSDDAYLVLTGAQEVTIKNVIVESIVPNGNKSYYIRNLKTDHTKIVIQDCYFGDNIQNGTGSVYNLMEINSILLSGSEVSGCYFTEHCAEHNDINIYQVDNNATIKIHDNTWERSANGIRVGVYQDAHATVDIYNCTYEATDEKWPDYAGLLLVQPYGKATTTMENLTITLRNITHFDDKQLFYLYAGGNDMQFTDYNKPTIIVDGEIVVSPKKETDPVVQDGDAAADDDF